MKFLVQNKHSVNGKYYSLSSSTSLIYAKLGTEHYFAFHLMSGKAYFSLTIVTQIISLTCPHEVMKHPIYYLK